MHFVLSLANFINVIDAHVSFPVQRAVQCAAGLKGSVAQWLLQCAACLREQW